MDDLSIDPSNGRVSGVWDFADEENGATSFDSLITALQSDGLYLNVHTFAHPAGEIRGQIISSTGFDSDEDGIPNLSDNCVSISNPIQEDIDSDGIGDVCDMLSVINVNTIVTSDFVSLGNLIIQGNSFLTIQSGIIVTVSAGNNVSIQPGSSILIKSGGTLQVNS